MTVIQAKQFQRLWNFFNAEGAGREFHDSFEYAGEIKLVAESRKERGFLDAHSLFLDKPAAFLYPQGMYEFGRGSAGFIFENMIYIFRREIEFS